MSVERQMARNQVIADRVAPLAARVAERLGCRLAGVRYLFDGGYWVLRVVIDRDGGVDVEHCAKVSRQLSALLDVEDFIGTTYTLEVSSPGLEKELLVAADFVKYAGQRVRIQTEDGPEGSVIVRGKLRGITRGTVLLDDDNGQRLELPHSRVAEARLEVEV